MAPSCDVFISHASEDKDAIARPLAEFLRSFGVKVWYDEHLLRVGDSLSEVIDKGLVECRFGVVIISQKFLSKSWARRELAGLVAKEIAVGKVILPVWHGVDVATVRKVSPPLADRFALSTDQNSIPEIGLKILQVVRPDIFENLQRWVRWRRIKENATPTFADLSEVKVGPRRHANLSPSLTTRARLLYLLLGEFFNQTFEEWVDLFCRDVHPHEEIEIWERIAVSYLGVARRQGGLSRDEKKEAYTTLLGLSFGDPATVEKLAASDDQVDRAVLEAWLSTGRPAGSMGEEVEGPSYEVEAR